MQTSQSADRVPATRWAGRFTPPVCHVTFAAVVLLNLGLGWRFLVHNCPVDLAGDEAQYWTWSRHLAWGYYSKGPLVAWIIRASCAVLGDSMPAVRAPALLLAVGTSCCTYWLARFLFDSDRLALGAFLLGGLVPMYAAGGTLMTIDPPLFFCWALATCLAAKGAFDGSRPAWLAAGVAAGVGVLAKYAMLLWPPLVLLFLAVDPASRRRLRSPWPWLMVLVSLAFLAPPLFWNSRHDWVTFRHVATQIGGEAGHASLGRRALAAVFGPFEFVGPQVAAVNPALCVFLVGGVVHALVADDPRRRQLRFLLTIGGGFWVVCLGDSFVTKVQPNWPAPAYFTLLILTAYFIATRWRGVWKPWRGWFWGAVAFGLVATYLVRDLTAVYPAVDWVDRHVPRADGRPRVRPSQVDMLYKLRGIRDTFAPAVDAHLQELPPGAFVLCEDYMDASQLAFYLSGQPKTYFAGSYWTDPAVRRRWTQFDVWPDRRLDRPELFDLDAIYVGFPNYAPLRQSFERVTRLPDVQVKVDGLVVRTWTIYRCEKFKGMRRPDGPGPR